MQKTNPTTYPIHELLQKRWSPRAFAEQMPDNETVHALFEAARWTPSSMNAQPWFFILASQQEPETYARMFSTLNERNQGWAKTAPLLVLAVMQSLRDNGKPHRWAAYDLGQAVANLTFEASARGLFVHQMGGFDLAKAAALYELPAGYEPMAVLTIGYAGDAERLPPDQPEREFSERTRKAQETFVFDGAWQQTFPPA